MSAMVSEEKLEQYREDALREEYEEMHQAYCTHENAYIQEFRATVKGDEPSEIFELEAEHYCPDCGKTRWVHFDLDDDMYYKSPRGWISVTGESSEVLED